LRKRPSGRGPKPCGPSAGRPFSAASASPRRRCGCG